MDLRASIENPLQLLNAVGSEDVGVVVFVWVKNSSISRKITSRSIGARVGHVSSI